MTSSSMKTTNAPLYGRMYSNSVRGRLLPARGRVKIKRELQFLKWALARRGGLKQFPDAQDGTACSAAAPRSAGPRASTFDEAVAGFLARFCFVGLGLRVRGRRGDS